MEDEREVLDKMLQQLACPFTWNTPPTDPRQVHDILVDSKSLIPMAWNEVIIKTKLAYSHCVQRRSKLSLPLITEAYMRLLPAFDGGDDLVRSYSSALKHMVDATWAFVCRSRCNKSKSVDSLRALVEFVREVGPKDALCPHQQAALVAIQAKCALYPDCVPFARKAILMHEEEGHWHLVLGKQLLIARRSLPSNTIGISISVKEELSALETAFKLRKNVETYVFLAISYFDSGRQSKALEIIKEGVERFPKSPWLLSEAATLAEEASKPLRNMSLARRWLERALECGGDCPHVRLQLGKVFLHHSDLESARPHFQAVADVSDEARELLAFVDHGIAFAMDAKNRGFGFAMKEMNLMCESAFLGASHVQVGEDKTPFNLSREFAKLSKMFRKKRFC